MNNCMYRNIHTYVIIPRLEPGPPEMMTQVEMRKRVATRSQNGYDLGGYFSLTTRRGLAFPPTSGSGPRPTSNARSPSPFDRPGSP